MRKKGDPMAAPMTPEEAPQNMLTPMLCILESPKMSFVRGPRMGS